MSYNNNRNNQVDDEALARALQEQYNAMSREEEHATRTTQRKQHRSHHTSATSSAEASWDSNPTAPPMNDEEMNYHATAVHIPPGRGGGGGSHGTAPITADAVLIMDDMNHNNDSFQNEGSRYLQNNNNNNPYSTNIRTRSDEEYARKLQQQLHDQNYSHNLQLSEINNTNNNTNSQIPVDNPDTTNDAQLAAAIVLAEQQQVNESQQRTRGAKKSKLCCCLMELPWWIVTVIHSVVASICLFGILFVVLGILKNYL